VVLKKLFIKCQSCSCSLFKGKESLSVTAHRDLSEELILFLWDSVCPWLFVSVSSDLVS